MTKIRGSVLTNFYNVMMGLALAPAIQSLSTSTKLTSISYTYFIIIGLFAVKYMLETDRLDGVLFDLNKVPAWAEFSFIIARILCLLAVCVFVQYILVDGGGLGPISGTWLSRVGIILTSIMLLLSYAVQDATTLLIWRRWLGTKKWSRPFVPEKKFNNNRIHMHNSIPVFLPYTISIRRMAFLLRVWLYLDVSILGLFFYSLVLVWLARGNAGVDTMKWLEVLTAGVLALQIVVPFLVDFDFYFGNHTKPDENVFHLLQSMSEKVKSALSTPFSPPKRVEDISEMQLEPKHTGKGSEQFEYNCKLSNTFLDDYADGKLALLLEKKITKTAKENIGPGRLLEEDEGGSIVDNTCAKIVGAIEAGDLIKKFEDKWDSMPKSSSRQILEETLDEFIGKEIARATCRFAPIPCLAAFNEMIEKQSGGRTSDD